MSEIILDYSTSETKLTSDISMLKIFTNEPNGLLTVSRISARFFSHNKPTDQMMLVISDLLELEQSTSEPIDVVTLAQVMDKVAGFVSAVGGAAIGAIEYDAPEELAVALQASFDPFVTSQDIDIDN